MAKTTKYYVPDQSVWPIIGSATLFILVLGAGTFIQHNSPANGQWNAFGTITPVLSFGLWVGLALVAFLMFYWFRDTIRESLSGMNSEQMDRSYRMGMSWFIFSEVMFFAAFFGTLFYARLLSVPWLAGEGDKFMTHELLWPNFQAMWPLTTTPDGRHTEAMGPWGLPLMNTILLVTSSLTLTFAHHALLKAERAKLSGWLFVTLALGFCFLGLQAYEYHHAYAEMGLTLNAGIYGSTFFMLTGFHGLHVTIGATMLTIMFLRSLKPAHLTPGNHFAFEASAWYWHFVDVVWLFLFVVVYWL